MDLLPVFLVGLVFVSLLAVIEFRIAKLARDLKQLRGDVYKQDCIDTMDFMSHEARLRRLEKWRRYKRKAGLSRMHTVVAKIDASDVQREVTKMLASLEAE